MKVVFKYIMFLAVAIMGVVSCIYPFTPDVIPEDIGLLVVEGEISAGIESAFTASESFSLMEKGKKATSVLLSDIYVEGESGMKYNNFRAEEVEDFMFEGDKRTSYFVDTRSLKMDEKHRLCFKYKGKNYTTSWLEFVETPRVDSLTYEVAEDETFIDILVCAKGINDSLRYFKWEYKEDWEFHAEYQQQWILVNGVPVIYSPGEIPDNYYCWNTHRSTDINLMSTELLSDNVIKDHRIKAIGYQDRRISSLYRIEVYQKGLSQEAYKYWETLLKNNEGTGGIFAPQPNELRGNIYCVDDPNEMVLGYITSCRVEKATLYINYLDHKIYKSAAECTPFQWIPNDPSDPPSDAWGVFSYDSDENEVFYIDSKCLSCLPYGTKNKPADWPTAHE